MRPAILAGDGGGRPAGEEGLVEDPARLLDELDERADRRERRRRPARRRRGRRSSRVARAPAGRRPRSRPREPIRSRRPRIGPSAGSGPVQAVPLATASPNGEAGSRATVIPRASRSRLSALSAGPKPERPRSRSSLTTKSSTRGKKARAARSSRNATRSGSGLLRISSRAERRTASRAASPGSERLRRGGPRGGAGAAALEPRQQVPRELVAEGAQVGLVLERVELRQAGLEGEQRDAEPLRARAQLLVERLGHQQDRRGAGQPGGVAHDVEPAAERGARLGGEARGRRPAGTGVRAAASRSISRRAMPGLAASETAKPAAARRSPTTRRTSGSSSSSRTTGPVAGRRARARLLVQGQLLERPRRRRASSAGGALKEASRAAAASRRSSSSLRARSSISSSGLMP